MRNFALLFTLMIALSGCKMEACKPGQVSCGTGTGNPARESQIGLPSGGNSSDGSVSPVTGQPSTVATELLLAGLCKKVNECAPQVSVEACRAKVQDLASLHPQIGIDLSGIDSYGAAILAERSGSLHANEASTRQCVADIEAISCSDERIEELVSSSGDLDVSPLLAPACKSIF